MTEQRSGWGALRQLFIAEATKEMLKARFGLAAVPFCMVFDKVRPWLMGA